MTGAGEATTCRHPLAGVGSGLAAAVFGALVLSPESGAKSEYRRAFYEVYPDAVGTRIETLPSNSNHCGACHWNFNGGGNRNPYGSLVEDALGAFPDTDEGKRNAILSIQSDDPDGDGFSTLIEVTDTTTYANTPTFPGLTAGNYTQTTNVTWSEIVDHLAPALVPDTTPPVVTVTSPNGGETATANDFFTVTWTATDNGPTDSGVDSISIHLSLDSGATWSLLAKPLPNSGTFALALANRPSTTALIRVTAVDNATNEGSDESDSVFTIQSPPGGRVPTTLRDFDMPGTQPREEDIVLNDTTSCASCHADYDAGVEPHFNWQGSMMSMASRDPLFEANLVIANQDAPDSGDLCLRCHQYNGWVQGRSVPTDGSSMHVSDLIGVSCDQCHRMVDPVYEPGVSPAEDEALLAALTNMTGIEFGNGMLVVDPDSSARRGPFDDPATPHSFITSPFHRESALCGSCHDVSNPVFERDGSGNYVANAMDTPTTNFSSHNLVPVERTYSEWLNSEYNTPDGVVAPAFAGNAPGGVVRSCQDCHMRDHLGEGADPFQFPEVPQRPDLPLHDMTGGSSWLMSLMPALHPTEVNAEAVEAGILRSNYLLENAATLETSLVGDQMMVRVINESGHKLPTGYPEGRRVWLNARFYDELHNLIAESAAYDPATGVLDLDDPTAKIYEVKPGLDNALATALGLPEGPSFHFVLNNKIFKDNRIPPRGFTNAAFAAFGGAPVAHTYSDGQYWDDTYYNLPAGAAYAQVTLYYQSTSKEFVEFLRDENTTNSKGQELYDLWAANGKCPPVTMATASLQLQLVVTTTTLPDAQVGAPWAESFSAAGGTGPYTWNISGSVPPGLILSPDGTLAGTPTMAGDYAFTMEVTDSAPTPATVHKAFVLSVADAPAASTHLVAVALSDSEIGLSWTDRAGNEDGYVVQHSPNGSTGWANLVLLPANSTSHTHGGLAAESTHFYRVAPYVGATTGTHSNIAGANTEVATTAAQVTRYPLADAHVKEGGANDNFGSDEKLLTSSKNNDRHEAYLRFDVSGLNTIESATLELYRIASNKNTNAIIHSVADDSWTENGITWNNRPTPGAQLVNQSVGSTIGEYKSFDLTTCTAGEAGGDGLLTVLFTVDGSNDTHEWWAREYSGVNQDPRLVIFHSSSPGTPVAPTGLIVSLDPSGLVVTLNWTDTSNGETGFLIERSPDGVSGWEVVGSTAANHTSWSDTGLDPATSYTYRVRAANTVAQSGSSSLVSATTASPAVTIPADALHFSRIGGMLEYRFPSEAGVTYELQHSGDLVHWTSSGYSAAGHGGETVMSWPEPPSESRQFYRIVCLY